MDALLASLLSPALLSATMNPSQSAGSASAAQSVSVVLPASEWSILEWLSLAEAVHQCGFEHWNEVSRALQKVPIFDRQPSFYSPQGCAQEYRLLADFFCPNRDGAQKAEQVLKIVARKLNELRVTEIQQSLHEIDLTIRKINQNVIDIKSGNLDEYLLTTNQQKQAAAAAVAAAAVVRQLAASTTQASLHPSNLGQLSASTPLMGSTPPLLSVLAGGTGQMPSGSNTHATLSHSHHAVAGTASLPTVSPTSALPAPVPAAIPKASAKPGLLPTQTAAATPSNKSSAASLSASAPASTLPMSAELGNLASQNTHVPLKVEPSVPPLRTGQSLASIAAAKSDVPIKESLRASVGALAATMQSISGAKSTSALAIKQFANSLAESPKERAFVSSQRQASSQLRQLASLTAAPPIEQPGSRPLLKAEDRSEIKRDEPTRTAQLAQLAHAASERPVADRKPPPEPSVSKIGIESERVKRKASDATEGDISGPDTSDSGSLPAEKKRAIGATPKNADENKRKAWKRTALMIWSKIADHRCGNVFMHPVKKEHVPDYFDIIKQPMNLATIKNRIRDGEITTNAEFHRDLLLILNNARLYNREDSEIYKHTTEMNDYVEAEMRTLLYCTEEYAGRRSNGSATPLD
ncbi:uncharacterized protein BJ171DRAFT_484660 [Polychytrium aggregatum]|uniref:uncharacterized protein n=1 Tax=Polychytrium aggregatum TaxID=110093 RepID=UPI0022FEC524|nr:uncharacterized protein BJ171DRAFT_484660 [Polychytrium aggregatum]KAI9209662.1 hypothetical protein BJ171DRAFT_484660 [Polychytrium aggregatum]